jgi:hypothetical protein
MHPGPYRMPLGGSGAVAGRPSRPARRTVLHAAGAITLACVVMLGVVEGGMARTEPPPGVVMIYATGAFGKRGLGGPGLSGDQLSGGPTGFSATAARIPGGCR